MDFETSGHGDRAAELADFVEHIAVWAHAGIIAEAFLDRFDLNPLNPKDYEGFKQHHDLRILGAE